LATPDLLAILILITLWLLFFWRLFTPIEGDQASLTKGDFSGQFVAFAAYQYQRLSAGEVPLWDPYNNGGLPFIADTQAAVFYPPRLATIALCKLTGGFSYHALELEMTAHVLTCSLLMYGFMRRLTPGSMGSIFGALVGAVIASYGGFLQSYPPLQLAVLEAVIWLPLAALGILEATRREQIRWIWLAVTGFALGLSWMAGHPQSSWFLTFLLVGYLAHRVYLQRYNWKIFVAGTLVFGMIAGGTAAVQLLPGLEYLTRTARTSLTFDAKGNGFPFQDVVQFIFPRIVSLWSPLFVGIVGLTLALIAIWRRLAGSLFWGAAALVSLGLSFGANSPIFALFYNTLPGLRFFRGQERAAYLVAFSLAILAGMAAAHLAEWKPDTDVKRRLRQTLTGLFIVCAVTAGFIILAGLGNTETYGKYVNVAAFSAITAGLALLLMTMILANPNAYPWRWLLGGLLVLELFTVSMDARSNYDPVPPQQQLSFTPPPLVAQALGDQDIPFRVDGFRGLYDNFGSLYDLADMRGISPLFLDGPAAILQGDLINPRAWELFAVRYVYTDWKELPVASQIIGSGTDRYGAINLHRLTDPRPFAHLVYDAAIVDSDAFARALLADKNFNPRQTIILNQDPGIALTKDTLPEASAVVTVFKPEQFTVHVKTPSDGILSLAHPDYPGWVATIDSQPTAILRAYGAFSAVVVRSGEHTIQFSYNPVSYRLGAIISLVTWLSFAILTIVLIWKRKASAALY
jgi:hypothetical protein